MPSPTCCSFLLLLQFSLLLPASCSENHWDYKLEGASGPSHWGHDCKGQSQSPLDIPKTGLTKETFPPLSFSHYDLQPASAILRNNGHTTKLSTKPTKPEVTPLMSGGGLAHSYKFAQVHFHWGADDKKGSEHLIGGHAYPMEMHLVHYKATHSNITEAVGEGAYDSLAVLGIFFFVSDQPNPGLASLLPLLDQIKTAETKAEATPFPISSLFTEDISSFFRYNGSLTTPGCNAIVQWTVVKDPMPATKDQLAAFRKLLTKESEPLVDNFRPPQKLGERQVLDVTTVQRVAKESHSSPAHADRVKGVGVVVSMVMVLMVKMASL
eukprot:GFUD01027824.1.p1 GENE.GFUD01027824.1~~GFUD01027824.1.p1  ORF type:complete len:324 (+),score=97.37 GFUD01027824.1:91-1062(+)